MATIENQAAKEQGALEILGQIRDLLERKLPGPPPKRPWWKPRAWQVWTAVLLLSLFFLDFPSETRTKADIIVLNGTEISLVKLQEPDWEAVGVKPSPEYWRVPNPQPHVNVTSLWEVSLYRQGRRYKHSAVRVVRREDEPLVDLVSPPVRVYGPTNLVLNPISEFADDDQVMARSIIRTHAIKAGDQLLPFGQIIDPATQTGRLVVETRPGIGWDRFKENLSTAFGLLK